MRFSIDIWTENAAFEPPGGEIKRILDEIGEQIEGKAAPTWAESYSGSIHDLNGNKVGSWEWWT